MANRGISTLGLLFLLVGAAAVLVVAFRIGPLYVDNWFVKASVEALADEELEEMSDAQIRRALERYFTVNGVRDLSPRDASIERDARDVTVVVEYERRVPLIGNVDAVVHFTNRYSTAEE